MIFKRCKICFRFIDLNVGEIFNGKYCHEYSDWQDIQNGMSFWISPTC
jgi:hypothetical protein